MHALHPRHVFRISRAARTEVRNVFVRVEDAGIVGYGEAAPNAFYGEWADDVEAKLRALADWMRPQTIATVADIERVWDEAWPRLQPSRAAQCALDIALWDLVAKRAGVSVAELALGRPPRTVASFCTIGVSSGEELEMKTAELRRNPFIKIKSDRTADLAPVRFVRENTAAQIAVDANCAWGEVDLDTVAQSLAELGVIFIEQPLPPAQDERMADIESCLPIIADECCATIDDVERMPGRFAGFNIKLVKCGGLTPALKMLRRGRKLGLKIMVGCMLESSLLISAGAVIAHQADFADLDGAWLLGDDPFTGLRFENGLLTSSSAPGFGVEPAAGPRFFL